jgi:predicted house-cleaning noncanonical NTP pyrophosphatase (MazG superfamily)
MVITNEITKIPKYSVIELSEMVRDCVRKVNLRRFCATHDLNVNVVREILNTPDFLSPKMLDTCCKVLKKDLDEITSKKSISILNADVMHELVRDKYLGKIIHKGNLPIFKHASEDDIKDELKSKLKAEVDWYCKTEDLEHLINIVDLAYSICSNRGVSINKFEQERNKKKEEEGLFNSRLIHLGNVEYIEV